MNKNCLIYETLNGVKEMSVKKDGDLMTLSGVFGVCGVRNNNQRVYEASNYSKMVSEMKERIAKEGGIPGELEHPQVMNITLENVSHKITDINIDENGLVTGSITLLNTPKGKIAQAIVEGGLPLFISSRATGCVDKNTGNVTLEKIATYDLVGSPGFSQAKLNLSENQVAECINESQVFYITETELNENNDYDMNIEEIMEKLQVLEEKVVALEEENEALKEQLEEIGENNEKIDLEKLSEGIQNWIVNEYSPEIQNWAINEFAQGIQNWTINEFSPEIQNWLNESYKETIKDMIKESINESKQNNLSAIDETLKVLESIEVTKPTYSNKTLITENANEPKFIQEMPAEVRVKWDLASNEVKESITRRAKLYNFINEGSVERFWNSINFDEIKPVTNIYEGLENITDEFERNIRAKLRSSRFRKSF